ncbi:MAG TPA: replication-associated recombination protein A [Acidimicrobiia bacterium]|nr:replication-associated recombination protein A [Acidimicrobiia bacterium]
MDDLFAGERADRRRAAEPLAARMRPASLEEVVGQEHLRADDAAFGTMVRSGRPASMILWGPPGTGKTTLARLVAGSTDAAFEPMSATSAGVKEVREVLASARHRLEQDERRTVLFLDEIHRFTKAQQDALLPGVEDGTVILVGATTENPFFEVNSPLISRSLLFRLEPLGVEAVGELIERAMADRDRGVAEPDRIDEEAARLLAGRSGGDARLALNALEVAAVIAAGRGEDVIGIDAVEQGLQHRVIRYDKAGDQHYDVISAFIKSLRGSDPDAAAYWLQTMLDAGEDPEFIARRMVILASEDVGLADPRALAVAVDAAHALQFVGLPEASYALHHAALYLATAPKSNSVGRTISAARAAVEETPAARVPPHLRSTGFRGAEKLGHGVGYVYPHDHPGNVAAQQYLPDEAAGRFLYRPGDTGAERELAERLADVDERMGRAGRND